MLLVATPGPAQVRETPKAAKGGRANSPAWGEPPELFRQSLAIPPFPRPASLARWEKDRVKVRETLVRLLGDLPPRPDPRAVKVVARGGKGGYVPERIAFLEGVLGATCQLYGKPGRFESVVYARTGHGYLPEMRARMLAWFRRHLPAEK